MSEDIYQSERDLIKQSIKLLDNQEHVDWKSKFEEVVGAYELLLDNMVVMTNISDRFQDKYKLANDKLQSQAEQIALINQKLEVDNRSLKSDLKEINKQKEIEQLLEPETFFQKFPDKTAVLDFFHQLKWTKDFSCKKCSNTKYCEGNSYLARRCTKCRYDESITAYTLFHKCKFDLNKGLYMLIYLHFKKGQISSYELSRKLELRQKTCWSFKQKVMLAFDTLSKNVKNNPEAWSELILTENSISDLNR